MILIVYSFFCSPKALDATVESEPSAQKLKFSGNGEIHSMLITNIV